MEVIEVVSANDGCGIADRSRRYSHRSLASRWQPILLPDKVGHFMDIFRRYVFSLILQSSCFLKHIITECMQLFLKGDTGPRRQRRAPRDLDTKLVGHIAILGRNDQGLQYKQ